ncbi:hypothetical protein BN2127_JRS10_02387 [Bacillus subtilis]|nr:hypothetical protein BN2127_JRS10_02387 [Bacillus subtilis]
MLGLIVTSLTCVFVVGVGVVTDTGGKFGSGWYWNETVPSFSIKPVGGIDVT